MRLLPLPLLLASAQTAWADAPVTQDAGSNITQMLGGLAVVLVMLVGSLWLLKRLTVPQGSAHGLMRVVAGTAVGPRERVVLLEIGSTWLVLGVAPGEVSMLAEIPHQDLPPTSAKGQSKDFANWLKQVIDRRHGSQT